MALDRPPAVTTKLGKYELLKEQAGSGIGSTWLARVADDATGTGELYTFLRLHRHILKKVEAAEAFAAEAQKAQPFRHPNALSLLDLWTNDGEVFVVTEHTEGKPLPALIAAAGAEGLPLPVVLRLGLDILEALNAANALTPPLAHGELGPQHIRVTAEGVAKVGGFAVACALSRLSSPTSKSHERLAYAAPERVKAMAAPLSSATMLDPRSDLFSLAVLLWELISQKRLFLSKIEAAVIQKVLTAPIPPLSSMPELDVPPALDEALQKALERDPARRFQSASEMMKALSDLGPDAIASRERAAEVIAELTAKVVEQKEEEPGDAKKGLLVDKTPSAAAKPASPAAPPIRPGMVRKQTLMGLADMAPLAAAKSPSPSSPELKASEPASISSSGEARQAAAKADAAAPRIPAAKKVDAEDDGWNVDAPKAQAGMSDKPSDATQRLGTPQPLVERTTTAAGKAANPGSPAKPATASKGVQTVRYGTPVQAVSEARHEAKLPDPKEVATKLPEPPAPREPSPARPNRPPSSPLGVPPPAVAPPAAASPAVLLLAIPPAPPLPAAPPPPAAPSPVAASPAPPVAAPAAPRPPAKPTYTAVTSGGDATASAVATFTARSFGQGKSPSTEPKVVIGSTPPIPPPPPAPSPGSFGVEPGKTGSTGQTGSIPTGTTPADPPADSKRGRFATALDKLGPGSTLGRYEILMPVARGGMASVWGARLQGTRGFQKIVAIKTMLPDVSDDPDFESMFLDEAKVAARIRHPNVAEILDLGEQDDVLYLVMEWVEGENLSTVLKAARNHGGIPLPIALRIASQTCAGLHAAHELRDDVGNLVDLIHRDVSPANVLVSMSGFVKLVDFGVAKSKNRLHVTRAGGMVKGKTPYLSPEQLGQLPIDRRSDIFSFGALLYVLVTGLHPFRGESEAKTVENIAIKDPVSIRSIIPALPLELEKLIFKALEKEPSKRFSTAAELQRAIDQVAVSIGAPTTDQDVAEFVRKVIGDVTARRAQELRNAIAILDADVVRPDGARSSELPPRPPTVEVARAFAAPTTDPPTAPVLSPFGPRLSPVPRAPLPSIDDEISFEEIREGREIGPLQHVGTAAGLGRSAASSSPSFQRVTEESTPPTAALDGARIDDGYAPAPRRRPKLRLIVGGAVGACALIGVLAIVAGTRGQAKPAAHADSPQNATSAPLMGVTAAAVTATPAPAITAAPVATETAAAAPPPSPPPQAEPPPSAAAAAEPASAEAATPEPPSADTSETAAQPSRGSKVGVAPPRSFVKPAPPPPRVTPKPPSAPPKTTPPATPKTAPKTLPKKYNPTGI